jgi:hypothetical protein
MDCGIAQKDKVNKDVLMKIKVTFDKAVQGKTGRLTQDEFAAAFAGMRLFNKYS